MKTLSHAVANLVLLGTLAGPPVNAAPPQLSATVDDTGITSLHYGTDELLSRGDLHVDRVTLADSAGKTADAETTPSHTTFDTRRQRVTRTYPWGYVDCTYATNANRLNVTIEVRNTSTSTLSGIQLQLLEVKFPAPPTGWTPNFPYLGANRGDPTIELANYGSGSLAVCDDDVKQPLLVGFPGRADLQTRPILVSTSNINYLSPYLDPYLKRPIAPGGSDTFHISLRFGPPTVTALDLGRDLYHKLAATFPSRLHWTDHRPIGTLHLAVTEPQYHSPTNPRGWFGDKQVDVTSATGRAAFRTRVLKYADDSIVEVKRLKAQGMITWDLEGEEYPQSTTYIGDPRLLGELAPEMEAIADEYFRKFREAGLRTGVCIRPQQLIRAVGKANQAELPDPAKVTQLLYDKMKYANRRWGCTIFYVDSNGDPNVPYDPAIFENLVDRLNRDKIPALVMPEHRNTRYYDCTAPYTELRLGVVGTPERVRVAYPNAFMANYVPDGPIAAKHDALVEAVKSGDILMFRGWWADPQNTDVLSVYEAIRPPSVTVAGQR
jgi:hypothetical protein